MRDQKTELVTKQFYMPSFTSPAGPGTNLAGRRAASACRATAAGRARAGTATTPEGRRRRRRRRPLAASAAASAKPREERREEQEAAAAEDDGEQEEAAASRALARRPPRRRLRIALRGPPSLLFFFPLAREREGARVYRGKMNQRPKTSEHKITFSLLALENHLLPSPSFHRLPFHHTPQKWPPPLPCPRAPRSPPCLPRPLRRGAEPPSPPRRSPRAPAFSAAAPTPPSARSLSAPSRPSPRTTSRPSSR